MGGRLSLTQQHCSWLIVTGATGLKESCPGLRRNVHPSCLSQTATEENWRGQTISKAHRSRQPGRRITRCRPLGLTLVGSFAAAGLHWDLRGEPAIEATQPVSACERHLAIRTGCGVADRVCVAQGWPFFRGGAAADRHAVAGSMADQL